MDFECSSEKRMVSSTAYAGSLSAAFLFRPPYLYGVLALRQSGLQKVGGRLSQSFISKALYYLRHHKEVIAAKAPLVVMLNYETKLPSGDVADVASCFAVVQREPLLIVDAFRLKVSWFASEGIGMFWEVAFVFSSQ